MSKKVEVSFDFEIGKPTINNRVYSESCMRKAILEHKEPLLVFPTAESTQSIDEACGIVKNIKFCDGKVVCEIDLIKDSTVELSQHINVIPVGHGSLTDVDGTQVVEDFTIDFLTLVPKQDVPTKEQDKKEIEKEAEELSSETENHITEMSDQLQEMVKYRTVTIVNLDDCPNSCTVCRRETEPTKVVIGNDRCKHIRFYWLCEDCYQLYVVI